MQRAKSRLEALRERRKLLNYDLEFGKFRAKDAEGRVEVENEINKLDDEIRELEGIYRDEATPGTVASLNHIQSELEKVVKLIDGDSYLGIRGLRYDLIEVVKLVETAKNERITLRDEIRSLSEALEQERRERIALQEQMAQFAKVLESMGAKIPQTRPWYREWAGPILSLVTILMLFYMLGVLSP